MTKLQFNDASYLGSATALSQCLPDQGAEIAFMGRSNAGKSSAINAITNIKGLARASTTPGRTQMINFFGLDDTHRLVDLPGYGYAKASVENKSKWEYLIADYLESRESLVGFVLVMDCRHPLKPMDQQFVEWCVNFEIPLHILLTKADKLTPSAQKKALLFVEKSVSAYPAISVQLFSSLKKTGVDEARKKLAGWLNQ